MTSAMVANSEQIPAQLGLMQFALEAVLAKWGDDVAPGDAFLANHPYMLVVIIIGGIYSGVFTATEAAAVSAVYAFFVSVFVYKAMPMRDLPKVLLQSANMNPGRTTQSISGTPPLDVVIGNAADVTITWRGARVDLAPYTRGNVARLTLE